MLSDKNKGTKPDTTMEEGTFYMAESTGAINLDPLHAFTSKDAQFYTAFYEGLVTYHPFYLSPVPGVARRWEISKDKKVYTFYLRENALFNNGEPVLAEDFRNSWLRVLDPKEKAEYSIYFDIIKGAYDYRTGESTDPNTVGIKVISDHVLEIELEKPASHLLKLLCHMTFVPVYSGYLKKINWSNDTSLVSNGPYNYFRKNNNEIILIKNNLYWNSNNIEIEKIHVYQSDDLEEVTQMFNEQKLHWAASFDFTKVQNKNYITSFPSFSLKFYFFKTNTPPWDDYRIRRGLSMLLPWSEIRPESDYFYAETIIPAISGYPKQKGITQNEEEGLKLLSEAGFPGGKGLPQIVIKIGDGNSEDEDITKIMKATWGEKLGLDVKVVKVGNQNFYDELKKKDYTLGTMIWIGDYADPLSMLQIWSSDSNLNDAKFLDAHFDDLIDKAMSTEDEEERYKIMSEAEKVLLEKAVILPVRQHPSLNLINDDLIAGWYPNLLDIHPFLYLRFRENILPEGVVFTPPIKWFFPS